MQTIDNTLIKQEPTNSVEERTKAEKQQKGGANWFFWIAGVSVINSVFLIAGVNLNFIIGLGITQVIDYIAIALANDVDWQQYYHKSSRALRESCYCRYFRNLRIISSEKLQMELYNRNDFVRDG